MLAGNHCKADGLASDPFSLIEICDMEYNLLEHHSTAAWNRGLMVIDLGSKLQTYTYALMHFRSHETPSHLNREKNSAQITGYLSRGKRLAMDIIELYCLEKSRTSFYRNNPPSEAPQSADQPAHWTIFETQSLCFAVIYLLKITKFWQIDTDTVSTDSALSSVWNIFHPLARTKEDYYSRVCDIIKYILKVDWSSCKDEPIMIRSRRGANLAFDMLLRARNQFSETGQQRASEDRRRRQDASSNDAHERQPVNEKANNDNTENPFNTWTGDGMLSGGFDFSWEDWNSLDELFAGM
ncbi:MAG: hypothetical protein M1822_009283 [Bathelium mastoideum]|nr:MAG: hypothetical protein M1822_009283 [Bathelium mastoideum]